MARGGAVFVMAAAWAGLGGVLFWGGFDVLFTGVVE